jgi:hypothetical protein
MLRLFSLLHVYDLVTTSARTSCATTAATAFLAGATSADRQREGGYSDEHAVRAPKPHTSRLRSDSRRPQCLHRRSPAANAAHEPGTLPTPGVDRTASKITNERQSLNRPGRDQLPTPRAAARTAQDMPIRTWQAGLMTVPPVAALRCPPAPHEIADAISWGPRPRALPALRCSAKDGSS